MPAAPGSPESFFEPGAVIKSPFLPEFRQQFGIPEFTTVPGTPVTDSTGGIVPNADFGSTSVLLGGANTIVGSSQVATATGVPSPSSSPIVNKVTGLIGGASAYSWGQIFGNLGLILLGIMLIGISLTVGTRQTVINIGKGALR